MINAFLKEKTFKAAVTVMNLVNIGFMLKKFNIIFIHLELSSKISI
jgi:hypothetical protein